MDKQMDYEGAWKEGEKNAPLDEAVKRARMTTSEAPVSEYVRAHQEMDEAAAKDGSADNGDDTSASDNDSSDSQDGAMEAADRADEAQDKADDLADQAEEAAAKKGSSK